MVQITSKYRFIAVVFSALMTVLLAGLVTANAQCISASAYMEKTHISPKTGVSMGYRFMTGFEIGGFIQIDIVNDLSENGRNTEKSFAGVYYQITVFKYSQLQMRFKVRTGLVNE